MMMTEMFYIAIIVLFLTCTIFPVFHMINAFFLLFKKPAYMKKTRAIKEKSISVLVPCYNEQTIVETLIFGMKNLDYQNYEYIIINDGSTDHTLNLLKRFLDLEITGKKPNSHLDYERVYGVYKSKRFDRVIVIDKENGGKADSLNAGIAYSSNEIIITLDADSILDEKALSIVNNVFDDPKVVAAGGIVHVLQGRKVDKENLRPTMRLNALVRCQILEYFRGFYVYKASLARMNALAIISGAFGIFKREALIHVGGYRKTVGEDIDITLKIQEYVNQRKGLKVIFIPEAKCFTEVPEKISDLYKQRIRWQKAFTDCLVLYRKTFLKTLISRPVSFFFMIEAFFTGILCGYLMVAMFVLILLFFPSYQVFLIYIVAAFTLNTAYNLLAIMIARFHNQKFYFKDMLRVLSTLFLDLVLFRYLTLFFVLSGTIQYFINKEGWNKVTRTGRHYEIEQAK